MGTTSLLANDTRKTNYDINMYVYHTYTVEIYIQTRKDN